MSSAEPSIDNALDIACNKLSALFGRAAAKGFVDVYFIHQELMPFDELLPQARQKHVGMDDSNSKYGKSFKVAVY